MYQTCPTVKVKADNEQGFVVINESDFDKETQMLFGDESEGVKKLSVAEIRDALTAKGVEIPEGAKKAELQALLDASE